MQLENPQFKAKASTSLSEAQRQAEANGKRAKDLMDAYFGRIDRLAKGDALDSRLRFMLMDIIDMRHRNWEMRRKAEGPKKIEDVHKEARREAQTIARGGSSRLERGDRRDSGALNFPSRSMQDSQHLRRDDLPTAPLAATLGSRTASSDLSLRPQGGGPFASRQSPARTERTRIRIGGPSALGGAASVPPPPVRAGDRMSDEGTKAAERPAAAAAAEPAVEAVADGGLSPKEVAVAARKLPGDVRNKAKDLAEALLKGEALVGDTGDSAATVLADVITKEEQAAPVVILAILLEALNIRGVDMSERLTKLKPFFTEQLAAADSPVTPAVFSQAALGFVDNLADLVDDIPKAPAVFTEFVGEFVANGTVSFKEVVAAVLDAGERPEKEEGDEEEPDMPLVDVGEAGPIVMKLLAAIKVAKGEEAAKAQWQEAGVQVTQLIPSFEKDGGDKALLSKFEAEYLVA